MYDKNILNYTVTLTYNKKLRNDRTIFESSSNAVFFCFLFETSPQNAWKMNMLNR